MVFNYNNPSDSNHLHKKKQFFMNSGDVFVHILVMKESHLLIVLKSARRINFTSVNLVRITHTHNVHTPDISVTLTLNCLLRQSHCEKI